MGAQALFEGSLEELLRYEAAYPGARTEVALPVRLAMDKVGPAIRSRIAWDTGLDGTGTLIGIVDSGLDLRHPDFRRADGSSRVAWLLDLTQPAAGLHADLEAKYAFDRGDGPPMGAVFSREDIDMIANGKVTLASPNHLPQDAIGHGTHVAGIAAANAGTNPYAGVAPNADLVVVVATAATDLDSTQVVRGATFCFDVAEARPIVVNLSVSSTFGPRDGSTLFESNLASLVGPSNPGRAIIVAAGNGGDVEPPSHNRVEVRRGERIRVVIDSSGAAALPGRTSLVQGLVTARPGDNIAVGIDNPDSRWITPVGPGHIIESTWRGATATVSSKEEANEASLGSRAPAFVFGWHGDWPAGEYAIVLTGHGVADVYLDPSPDGTLRYGRREATIAIPAAHPDLIAVGCTANRDAWVSVDGSRPPTEAPRYDAQGGTVVGVGPIVVGEPCSFSAAGPNANGALKPDIAAPGFGVISSMSAQADPAVPHPSDLICPPPEAPTCRKVDDRHAVLHGTSMSAPAVSGAVALLFQARPDLTQRDVRDILQASAHPFRGPARFMSQSGPGELDVAAAVAIARDRVASSKAPARTQSRIHLSEDVAENDGLTPITALVFVRDEAGTPVDGFAPERLRIAARIDDGDFTGLAATRRTNGLWEAKFAPTGGSKVSFEATFDGSVVASISIPAGGDAWRATYPSRAEGGCTIAVSDSRSLALSAAFIALGLLARRRRARGEPADPENGAKRRRWGRLIERDRGARAE
jgi:subtilisin family serine protease